MHLEIWDFKPQALTGKPNPEPGILSFWLRCWHDVELGRSFWPPVWASCPDWVQTIIRKNIRKTIKAMMQQKHGVREDRCYWFTDDWAAIAAEIQCQISSQAPTRATSRIQSQTPSSLDIGALAAPPGNQFDLQETVTSFEFTQMARVTPTRLTPRIQSQTPSNLGIGALAAPLGNQFDSEEMVLSFDFS